ncbi:MAG TPA: DUF1684 domain-containing protein [Candidatus Krumholzibacteria bacterium]|nr:DUF1684 domain-containing protein [Candidatus Krumholzibacteria bacterium]
MNRFFNWSPVILAGALAACGGVSIGAGGSSGGIGVGGAMGESKTKYTRDIDDWHEARLTRLKAEDGWLTLVGLFPLPNGTHTFGSAKDNELIFPAGSPEHGGTLVVQDTLVTLTPAPGVTMTDVALQKERVNPPIASAMPLKSDRSGPPSKIKMGSIQFYVIDRPGSMYLRVKDANNPARKNFKGIDRFPVSKKWLFDATFERYNPPHLIKVANVLGYEENVQCPGAVAFEKDGKTYRLEALSLDEGELEIIYGDATSGHTTYGGGRFIYVTVPKEGDQTVIDFNKSYNPPCVFTEYATCPIPGRENILPFKVEAGEKAFGDPMHHSGTNQ